LVQARNTADGLAHAAKKTLEEAGDKASDEEKAAIEAAILFYVCDLGFGLTLIICITHASLALLNFFLGIAA